MADTKFGERLKTLRNERDLTMDMLVSDVKTSFNIEINKGLISRWEKGEVEPTVRYALMMAKYFNVSVDYLIGLTEVKTPTRLLTKEGKNDD